MDIEEFTRQCREILAIWDNNRNGMNRPITESNFPEFFLPTFSHSMEWARKNKGMSREEFVDQLRLFLLFD